MESTTQRKPTDRELNDRASYVARFMWELKLKKPLKQFNSEELCEYLREVREQQQYLREHPELYQLYLDLDAADQTVPGSSFFKDDPELYQYYLEQEQRSETVDDDESPYDVGYSRDQLVTFLLPEVSPKGTTLHIRIKEADKRIPTSLAVEELVKRIGEVVPVAERVWEMAGDILNYYIEDEDVEKDMKEHLETSMLVRAQHICATYPCQERFIVDLTQDECKQVTFDARPFSIEQDGLNGQWTHISYYDMSGDFRWVCGDPVRSSDENS